jgi:predicted RND superfamily exporter protein
MTRLTAAALAQPLRWVIVTLLLTLALGLGLRRLELRADGASIYPTGNATVDASAADAIAFDDPQQAIVLVSARPGGPPLDSPAGLRLVAVAHRGLAAIDGASGPRTRSIASLLDVRNDRGAIAVGSLLDGVPVDSAECAAQIVRLREQPVASGLLLARDGSAAVIVVPLAREANRAAFIARLERWAGEHRTREFDLRVTGPLAAEVKLGGMVWGDLSTFVPIMTALMALLLFVSLRSVAGCVLPMVEALVVLAWTFGAMGHLGIPVTLVTTILPVILMSTAITDEIHVLERVQDELAAHAASNASGAATRELLRAAMLAGLGDVRWPIIGSAVTTAIGFLSFLSASIEPLRAFGLAAGAGILLAMLLSFSFMPALAMLLPLAWFRTVRLGPARDLHALTAFESAVARAPGRFFAFGLLALALCAPGPFRLRVQDAWMDNFDPRAPLVEADHDINARFWGSYRFDVVLEAEPGRFASPSGAALMESVARAARREPHVGGVLTYLDPLATIARAIAPGDSLPFRDAGRLGELAAIAQSSPDGAGLRQLVTGDGSRARARIFVNSPNYRRADSLRRDLALALPPLLAGSGVRARFSGDLPVALEVVRAIVDNQLRSIGWSLLGIGLLLWLVYPRGRAAWIALAPVSATALVLFGVMGYAGMPLGIATSMFAGLAVGVGVDFALHFVYQHRIESARRENPRAALEATLGRTGRAIRWNALVVTLGFLALTLSRIPPNRNLGLLLAAAMFGCYAATLVYMPWLVRGLRAIAIALALLAPLALPGRAHAAPAESDTGAVRVMRDLERAFRRTPRALRMEVRSTYAGGQTLERSTWGVFADQPDACHVMYTFDRPENMAGATLLMRFDARDQADSTWLYLPSMKRMWPIGTAGPRLLVPGTTMSFEDARGFIPTAHYRFRAPSPPGGAGSQDTLWIVALPATDSLRKNLGYGRLVMAIDRGRGLIARIEFADADLRPVKRYELLDAIRFGAEWLPKRVRIEQVQIGMTSIVDYRYWRLRAPPPKRLFDPSDAAGPFLPRIMETLRREKIPID